MSQIKRVIVEYDDGHHWRTAPTYQFMIVPNGTKPYGQYGMFVLAPINPAEASPRYPAQYPTKILLDPEYTDAPIPDTRYVSS